MENQILTEQLKKTLEEIDERKMQINTIKKRIKLLEANSKNLIEQIIEKENEE